MNQNNVKDDIKQYNSVNFRIESIKLLLNDLESKGIITSNKDKEKLFEIYNKDNRNLYVIFEEIKKLNKNDIDKLLNKIKEEKQTVPNKVSLDNIKDFKNEKTGKSYISIHYPYPDNKVKVVENLSGKSAEELFEEKKDENNLVSIEGFVKSTDIYESDIEPNKLEVKMYNVTELAKKGEFQKLSKEEKEKVIGLVTTIVNELAGISDEEREKLKKAPVDELVKMFDKDVLLSPKENIVMICTPNSPKEDKVMTVTKNEKGEYKLTSLNAVGYEFVGKNTTNESKSESTSSSTSDEEDVLEENQEKEQSKEEMGIAMTKKQKHKKIPA